MSKSKLYVEEQCHYVRHEDTGEMGPWYCYYVRETGRTVKVLGPRMRSAEEALALLHRCELDEEYRYWQRYYNHYNLRTLEEEIRNMTDMTKTEELVFDYLFSGFDSDYCVQTFKSLATHLGITERQAKTACRRLKRRGYAEHSPYWDMDDGLLGGSGYTLTVAGIHEGRARQRASKATSETAGSRATAALTA
jgi:hypothetical protein